MGYYHVAIGLAGNLVAGTAAKAALLPMSNLTVPH